MAIGYFNNLGFLLLAYIVTHFIGHFIYGLLDAKEEKTIQAVFLKNTLGIFLIIFAYSVFKTHFFTINLGFIILIVFLLFHKKIKWTLSKKINIPYFLFQLFLLVLFYSVFYFKYYNPFDHTYHALFSDFPGYAAIVEKMNTHGLESRFPDFYYNPPIRELYHYGDLWLTAFFAFLFKKNALTVFYFILFPLATMIFYTGILALLNPDKLNYKIAILSIVLLFVSTLSVFYPKSIPFFDTEWGEFTLLNSPKRTLAGIVILTGTIFAAEKKYMLTILSLLTIVGIYTISLPMVFVASSVYISFLFFTKKITIKESLILFAPLVFIGVFLIVYMKICTDINLNYLPKETPKLIDLDSFVLGTYLVTSVKSFIGLLIKLLLGILPYSVLLFFLSKKDKIQYNKIAFILLLIIAGYIAHAILYFVAEANQLYTVTYIPAIAILVLLLVSPVFEEDKNYLLKFLGLGLLALCFYQNLFLSDKYENKVERVLNMKFIKEVTDNIPHNTPYLFGSIQNSDTNKLEWANFNIYYPYDHLKLYFDNYNPLFLSLDNLKPGSTKKNHIVAAQPFYIKTAPFYIYLNKKMSENPTLTYNEGMALFIKEARIKYILLAPNSTMPSQVSERVEKTIDDNETGFKMCILK